MIDSARRPEPAQPPAEISQVSGELGPELGGKHVLVTGGTGFIGSHLCAALQAAGAAVHVISRSDPRRGTTTAGTRWMKGDVSDADTVRAAWRSSRPELVFHLTTHGVGSPELEQVPATLMGDLVGTVNVLTAAARDGCSRIVLAASLEEPTSVPAVPTSPYGAAKWAATGYARMFHRLYQTPVVITRPFMTYGPRQGAHKLIPRTLRAIVAGQSPRVSSGLRRVDWVYVDDVVRGLLLAATKPGVEGGEFDLGSGTLVPVRAVIEKLLQLAGSSVAIEFAALSDRPFEVERRADTAATFARLGWKAQIPLEEGLTRTLAWFRAHDRGHSAGVAV